jgi:nitronate monooxygenase
MALPEDWMKSLDLPLVLAPMFLISNTRMIEIACKNGVIGSMPTGNARTPEILDEQIGRMVDALSRWQAESHKTAAPWALNLVAHATNSRLPADLAVCVKHRAPLVITALGSPKRVVEVVHAYGGRVFADVNSPTYARKAADAGVDGLVLVSSGAGGHTGQIAAPAFVGEVREFWKGPLIIAGGMMNGRSLRAAQILGADLAYMGTRFIATAESDAVEPYKEMILSSTYDDIICTNAITGAWANKLRPSLVAAGLNPDALPARGKFDLSNRENDVKAWKDLWSAGQGVGQVHIIDSVAGVIAEVKNQYRQAIAEERSDSWAAKYAS